MIPCYQKRLLPRGFLGGSQTVSIRLISQFTFSYNLSSQHPLTYMLNTTLVGWSLYKSFSSPHLINFTQHITHTSNAPPSCLLDHGWKWL